MFIDPTYIYLVLPAVLFSMWASMKVSSTFEKYSKVGCRLSGYGAARDVLSRGGVNDVSVGKVAGKLTDRYDPRNKTISLSDGVYDSYSVAAAGVAAHEAGHALQHAKGYMPLRIRNAIVPITNIGSKIAIPLIILGLLLEGVSQIFLSVAYFGIIAFATCFVFQLVTLPTEFNASRRALAYLREGGSMTEEELYGAKKVLSAAALTYVAALAVSLMQLLRLVILVGGRRRRN